MRNVSLCYRPPADRGARVGSNPSGFESVVRQKIRDFGIARRRNGCGVRSRAIWVGGHRRGEAGAGRRDWGVNFWCCLGAGRARRRAVVMSGRQGSEDVGFYFRAKKTGETGSISQSVDVGFERVLLEAKTSISFRRRRPMFDIRKEDRGAFFHLVVVPSGWDYNGSLTVIKIAVIA